MAEGEHGLLEVDSSGPKAEEIAFEQAKEADNILSRQAGNKWQIRSTTKPYVYFAKNKETGWILRIKYKKNVYLLVKALTKLKDFVQAKEYELSAGEKTVVDEKLWSIKKGNLFYFAKRTTDNRVFLVGMNASLSEAISMYEIIN